MADGTFGERLEQIRTTGDTGGVANVTEVNALLTSLKGLRDSRVHVMGLEGLARNGGEGLDAAISELTPLVSDSTTIHAQPE